MRHVISVDERRVEQPRVLRLHADGKQRHESLAELDGEESRGPDDVVNVVFADVHDVLALVDAVLHVLHKLLHRLLLLREVLSAISARASKKRTFTSREGERAKKEGIHARRMYPYSEGWSWEKCTLSEFATSVESNRK